MFSILLTSIHCQQILVLLISSIGICSAWVSSPQLSTTPIIRCTTSSFTTTTTTPATVPLHRLPTLLYVATTAEEGSTQVGENDDEDDDDDGEYEYIEIDIMTEAEYLGSEWLVGTCWDNNPDKIDETWVRLVADKEGQNVAIWGDNSQGKWSLDVASQFLSISKDTFWGKTIWAGIVDDYYFSKGTVRGWSFLQPASVLGQWQSRRLGVEKDEAGVAPWFEQTRESQPDPADPEAANYVTAKKEEPKEKVVEEKEEKK